MKIGRCNKENYEKLLKGKVSKELQLEKILENILGRNDPLHRGGEIVFDKN